MSPLPPPISQLPPPNPVGYALPVPASLVAADPGLIGEGVPAPRQGRPAGPVTLPVPAGTAVDAVTAGTIKVVPAADGTSVIVLSGADGATYTYANVTATARAGAATASTAHQKVRAGAELAFSDRGGFTFSISVPDVRGAVDAGEALQAWASGIAVNVRALPSTIAGTAEDTTTTRDAAVRGKAAPPRQQVLIVTGRGTGTLAEDLARFLGGPLVSAQTKTVPDARVVPGHDQVAQLVARSGGGRLVIVALANGTPGQAAALARRLPGGREVLWIAPPGTTVRQAAAYRAIVTAHRRFRVESLPAALTTAGGPTSRTAKTAAPGSFAPIAALATATLTASYVSTAYRLDTVSSQADAVLSWAEEQLGKPYKWAAAGPDSYDCSGLTMDAFAQSGITLPHNANAQWQQTRERPVAESMLAAGDLVFFAGSDGTRAAPGHVGIYVGDGEIIDAPYSGAKVRFDPVASVGGYTGATNPYAPVPAAGIPAAGTPIAGVPLLPAAGSLAVPAALSQYQSFAQGLVDSVWNSGQFPFLYMLWERESGWNPTAMNPLSGAFGIPQALPAVKMVTAGLDWATDPYTQITWGIDYIRAAYGSPRAAWAHELAYGWY